VLAVGTQVWLLRWDGQAALVASFGAGARAALLGALPDRLLLVRAAPGGRVTMATRAVSLLSPLLQAWATLPGSGLLPGKAPAAVPLPRAAESAAVAQKCRLTNEQRGCRDAGGAQLSSASAQIARVSG